MDNSEIPISDEYYCHRILLGLLQNRVLQGILRSLRALLGHPGKIQINLFYIAFTNSIVSKEYVRDTEHKNDNQIKCVYRSREGFFRGKGSRDVPFWEKIGAIIPSH